MTRSHPPDLSFSEADWPTELYVLDRHTWLDQGRLEVLENLRSLAMLLFFVGMVGYFANQDLLRCVACLVGLLGVPAVLNDKIRAHQASPQGLLEADSLGRALLVDGTKLVREKEQFITNRQRGDRSEYRSRWNYLTRRAHDLARQQQHHLEELRAAATTTSPGSSPTT